MSTGKQTNIDKLKAIIKELNIKDEFRAFKDEMKKDFKSFANEMAAIKTAINLIQIQETKNATEIKNIKEARSRDIAIASIIVGIVAILAPMIVRAI